LALAGRRLGCTVMLSGSSPQLRALLAFMGLAEVLPEAPPGATPAGRARPGAAEGRTAEADAEARERT
jgi:hypothetical protein